MNNADTLARHIANVSGMEPQDVVDSTNLGYDETEMYAVQDAGVSFDPAGLAVEQGQQAVVQGMKAKEEAAKEKLQQGRLAAAIADAMRAEVGRIEPEEPIDKGTPLTAPEPRESIQSAIKNVGVGGRKGVFSELPFEAEDVPEGWDVIETEDGGYMAAPQEHTDEVVANEGNGERSKSLGFMGEKKADHNQVVQVRDKYGIPFHEESAGVTDVADIMSNALDVAAQIKGSVSVAKPEEVLVERKARKALEVSDTLFNSFALIEGAKPKVYHDSVRKEEDPSFKGYKTVGVGFNMEQTGARKIWEAAGITKDFDEVFDGTTELNVPEMKQLLYVTIGNSTKAAEARAKELGVDWGKLPAWHKTILTDIAFNTGSVSGWKKVFTNTDKKDVLREARRLESKKHTMGMDNRVARIGLELGIIDTLSQARALGLVLADMPQSEVNEILKKRAKAKVTYRAPTVTAGVRG